MEYAAVSEANGWSEDIMRKKVPAFLRGSALRWYTNVKETLSTWPLFLSGMLEEFRPSDWRLKKKVEFHGMKQTTKEGVNEYIMRFRYVCGQLTGLAEEEKLERFVDGLCSENKRWVTYSAPRTLAKAMEFARRAESINFGDKQATKVVLSPSPVAKENVTEARRPDFDVDSLAEQLSTLVIKKLSSNHARTSNYSAEVTCYNCQGSGHKAWFCPEPNPKRDTYLKGKGLAHGESQKPKFLPPQ